MLASKSSPVNAYCYIEVDLTSKRQKPISGSIWTINKTAYDIYHWRKDEEIADKQHPPVISDDIKKKMDEFIENPKITINGGDIYFESYEELKGSKYFHMMEAALRMAGGINEWEMAEKYLEARMKEKQQEAG